MATKKKKKVVKRPLKRKIIKKVKTKVKAKIKSKAKIKVRVKPKVKAKAKPKIKAKAKAKEGVIGTITHYFPHVRAAVIKLKTTLVVGDKIKIKGHTTDLAQIVDSMQIDRVPVNSAGKGAEIGLLVNSRVRQHDVVYKA